MSSAAGKQDFSEQRYFIHQLAEGSYQSLVALVDAVAFIGLGGSI